MNALFTTAESDKTCRRQRCFVHIGTPKTGTTGIQKFIYNNQAELRQRGVLYPDVSLRGYGHHDLAFMLSGAYPDWATTQPFSLEQLESQLASATVGHASDILISSENFYLYPHPQRLLESLQRSSVLRTREPQIIVYLRRQDYAHESWYNQTIKAQGSAQSLEECMEHWSSLWEYDKQLDLWERTFGREHLTVRVYETAQLSGGSLLRDFLDAIGVDSEDLALPEERVNTALNVDLLEFQRILNRLPLPIVEKRRYHRSFMALSAASAGTGLFKEGSLIDGAMRRRILARYENGNQSVARRYFNREQLFVENTKEADGGAGSSTGLSAQTVTTILGWLVLTHLDQQSTSATNVRPTI